MNGSKIDKQKEARKLVKNIAKFMKLRGFSRYRLVQESSIDKSSLYSFLNGKTNRIEWITLYQIAQALDTTIDSLIAGSNIEVIDNPEHREIIAALPEGAKIFFKSIKRLPPGDVKAVIDIIDIIIEKNRLKGK